MPQKKEERSEKGSKKRLGRVPISGERADQREEKGKEKRFCRGREAVAEIKNWLRRGGGGGGRREGRAHTQTAAASQGKLIVRGGAGRKGPGTNTMLVKKGKRPNRGMQQKKKDILSRGL